MNATARKAWADLKAGWGQSLLAIAALALGLWGVGSILVANVILRADLRTNYVETRPPHAVLVSTGFGRLDLGALRARADVQAAEFRDFALLRVEVHPDDWIPLWLFGVRDFGAMQVATVARQSGAFPPAPGSMLVERDGRNISALDTGTAARIRAGGRMLDVPVAGIAFDPGQAPATQDHFIYGYVDSTTFAQLSGTPTGQRLLLRLRGVRSRADVERALEPLVQWLASQGIEATASVPNFEEHPHQWQLDTLLLMQGGIGLLAFAMGAGLVSQVMAALLARQVRQIAVLKAIGGTRGQLLRIYATMVAALGIAAGLLAVPLAWKTGVAFSHFVGDKLNFDVHPDRMPSIVFVSMAIGSVALPILVSLPTLLRALGASVREGLGDYGLGTEGVAPRATRIAGKLGGTFALAVRNAVRQRQRAAVTVLTMALGVAIFDAGFNVRQSLANLVQDYDRAMRHDVQVVLKVPVTREQALAPFSQLKGVRRIELWDGGRGELQTQIVHAAGGIGIVAVPHDTQLFRPAFVAGRWLRPGPVPEVVLNRQAAEVLGRPAPGAQLPLALGEQPLQVRVAGIVEELDKPKIYMDRDTYDRAANPRHLVNSVMIAGDSKEWGDLLRLKRYVEAALAATDLDVMYVMLQAERVRIIIDHLDIVLTALAALSLLVLVVSEFGMASATSIKVRERTREIGVLRAIGATPRAIIRIMTVEGMALGVVSVMLGLALAQPLSAVAAVAFGRLMLGEDAMLRYAFSAQGFAVVALTTLVFGWIASRLPAGTALRASTRDALAY